MYYQGKFWNVAIKWGVFIPNSFTHVELIELLMFSADNLTFGSGGALLQKVNRDTQKCAYKCSYALINGKGVCTVTSFIVTINP